MEKEKTQTYEQAMAELEKIVDGMEQGQLDIDTLGSQLKKAKQLITLCRDRLAKTDAEIKELLEKD